MTSQNGSPVVTAFISWYYVNRTRASLFCLNFLQFILRAFPSTHSCSKVSDNILIALSFKESVRVEIVLNFLNCLSNTKMLYQCRPLAWQIKFLEWYCFSNTYSIIVTDTTTKHYYLKKWDIKRTLSCLWNGGYVYSLCTCPSSQTMRFNIIIIMIAYIRSIEIARCISNVNRLGYVNVAAVSKLHQV